MSCQECEPCAYYESPSCSCTCHRHCAYCEKRADPTLPHHLDWPVCAEHTPPPEVIASMRQFPLTDLSECSDV